MEFWYLDKITRIWDDQPLSEPEKEAKSFSELEHITVYCCDQLEYVLPSYMLPQLKNLQKLNIQSCTKVEVIISNNPKGKEATNNNDTIRFSQLKTLKLVALPNLKSFICSDETQSIFSNKVAFPVLGSLNFRNLSKIIRIWDDQPLSEPEKEAKSLSELKDISVQGCDQLEYVLPSYMLPQLKNLQGLSIWNCTKVEVIISNNPKEKEATNNNDTIRFPQLKTLTLWSLPNLKSFICSDETQSIFSNKVAFPVLEELDFLNLDKITRIWDNQPLSEPEKEAKSFCQLKKILVKGCNQLEYVLPSYMLPQLKNILQKLCIKRCRKMEVIISNNPKEKEATKNNDTIRFPQMKEVELKYLPILKSFICSETQLLFSNKDAFPVLEKIKLLPRGTLEFLGNETSTKEEWCTSDEESDHNGEELDEKEWCTSDEESDHNGEELDENLKTPTTKVSVEDAFPVLEEIDLDEDSEISMVEWSTSNEESDHNGEELDEDLKTPTKKVSMEECSTSGKENDHNGEELDEDLETPTKEISMEECGTSGQSGKESEHNGEKG